MTDDESLDLILALQHLAIVVRDEDEHSVREACRKVLLFAKGDPIAALAAAAFLIPIDVPVDPWWLDPKVVVKVCSTCDQRKPLAEFGLDRARGDGHTYDCRECKRARDRQSRRDRQLQEAS